MTTYFRFGHDRATIRRAMHCADTLGRIALIAILCGYTVFGSMGQRIAAAQSPPPQGAPSPTGDGVLALTDLTLSPPTIQMAWTYPAYRAAPGAPPSPGGYSTPYYGSITYTELVREPGGTGLPYMMDGTTTYFDDENWSVNVTYGYHIHGTYAVWNWDSSHSVWIESDVSWDGPTYNVTVRQVAASASQTVDSRIDPRYSTYQLKNFQFANRLYRGGLYAGFNSDNSNVGRTYLKFGSLAGPITSGEKLWPIGGLSVYCTRLAQTGTATVQCRSTVTDTWDPTTLVWANAPAAISSGINQALSLSWTQTSPAEQWANVDVTPDLERALAGDGTLSLVISASSESGSGATTTASPGWAYFARPTYTEGGVSMGPYLLYAFGGPGALAVQSVTITPTTISAGTGSATVTVFLNANAPSGGATVALSSSSASVTVPATLSITGGTSSASFTVNGTTSGVTATITASLGSGSASGNVTVTP